MELHDDYTLEQLENMPTLHSGQYDNLKVEEPGECRVWLSRMTVADGMECDNLVTVERIIDGRWTTTDEYGAL